MTVRRALMASSAAITIDRLQRPIPTGMARLHYRDGEIIDVPIGSSGIVTVPRGGDVEVTYDVR